MNSTNDGPVLGLRRHWVLVELLPHTRIVAHDVVGEVEEFIA